MTLTQCSTPTVSTGCMSCDLHRPLWRKLAFIYKHSAKYGHGMQSPFGIKQKRHWCERIFTANTECNFPLFLLASTFHQPNRRQVSSVFTKLFDSENLCGLRKMMIGWFKPKSKNPYQNISPRHHKVYNVTPFFWHLGINVFCLLRKKNQEVYNSKRSSSNHLFI